MTPQVLVTGASGFVGRTVVERAAGGGYRVRAAVKCTPTVLPMSVETLRGFDLTRAADWRSALEGIDAVIHCAARVHVTVEAAPDPLAAFRAVNVDGTLALARHAEAAGARRFVFISTIGVNGAETFERPFRADDQPAPHSAYAQSKHEAELGLRQLAQQTGLEIVIVRPPLVHGPNAPGNFGSLMRAVHRGLPLPLASVNNRRSLVGVANLADLLVTCIDHPQAAGQTLLVSDGEDLSTPALLRRVAAALGTRARLFPLPVALLRGTARLAGRAGVAQQLCGSLQIDDGPTRERLDWSPPITLDAGLDLAARYFLATLGTPPR